MNTPTVKQVAEMLGRLSPTEVANRIEELRAEEKSLRTLLRTLRARESAARRRALREGQLE